MSSSQFIQLVLQNPQFISELRNLPGGPVGVLLLHGYTATPVEVSLLAEYLNQQGHTVLCPLLPGHGTTIEDLHTVTWKDWIQHAEQAFRSLQEKCIYVFVGGISLGGLVSLYLGITHPEINGLLIYSPALSIRNRWAFMANILKFIIKEIPKFRQQADKNLVNQRWQGYTSDSLPAVSQLLRLQRLIKKDLPRISQPIIIFQGRNDETILPQGAETIYSRVGSKDRTINWMEESAHSLLLDREWEKIAQATAAFISRIVDPIG